jgi:uncharacterized protein YjbJ (UPF0337 family)
MATHDEHEKDEARRLQTEGKLDELEGKAQSTWGTVTDDTGERLKGAAKEAWGKAQQTAGDALESLDDNTN